MATTVFKNASVTINAVDLSAWVTSVSMPYGVEQLDDTVMGDNTRSAAGGLKQWSFDIEFLQDWGASAPDVSLFAIVGTVVTVTVRPDAGVVSATNPNYTGSALVADYQPLENRVGEMATAKVSLVAAGDLSRATS